MQNKNIYAQIRDKIGQDELAQAIQDMKKFLEDSPKLDKVILQSARFKEVRNHIMQGTRSHDQTTVELNQIRAGLLDLLREMQTGEEEPSIQQIANEPQIIQNAEKIYNIDHIDQANFS